MDDHRRRIVTFTVSFTEQYNLLTPANMFPYNNQPRHVTLSVKQSIKIIVNGTVNIVIRNNNLNRHIIYYVACSLLY